MGKSGGIIAQGKVEVCRILAYRNFLFQFGITLAGSLLIAFLFYNSLWGMGYFPLLYFLSGRFLRQLRQKKELKQLNLEFKDYLYAVSGALAAGKSVERSFLIGLHNFGQLYGGESILAGRLCELESRLSLSEPLERILFDFAKGSGSEDIENFVEIFGYAKRGGGDFIHIINTSIGRICDKIEVTEEIHTVMAEKALEQKVMCVVPLGILLFFRMTSPEFIGKLYGNLFGICIMTAAVALYGISFYLGLKILEVEV